MGPLITSAGLGVALFLFVLGAMRPDRVPPVWKNMMLNRAQQPENERRTTEVLRTRSLFERFALAPSMAIEPAERLVMAAGVSDTITRTGLSMFLTVCSPRSSNLAATLPST